MRQTALRCYAKAQGNAKKVPNVEAAMHVDSRSIKSHLHFGNSGGVSNMEIERSFNKARFLLIYPTRPRDDETNVSQAENGRPWRCGASIPVPLTCKASALPFELHPLLCHDDDERLELSCCKQLEPISIALLTCSRQAVHHSLFSY